MYQPHVHDFQQSGLRAEPIERIKRNVLLIVEFVASVFALIPEVFFRVRFGRRYFTEFSIGATYFSTLVVYYVLAFLRPVFGGERKLVEATIDPFGMAGGTGTPSAPDVQASPDNLFLVLKVFVFVAILQRVLCFWRKVQRTEPKMAVYSGESVFAFALDWFPEQWITRIAFSSDDASKRYIEPLAVYMVSYLLEPVDSLVASLFFWTAVCLLVRAWSCRIRFQAAIDELQDAQEYSKQLFNATDSRKERRAERSIARLP